MALSVQRAGAMLRWVVPFVVLGVLARSPRSADACSCISSSSLCEGLSRVNTVFVGTVRDVVQVGRGDLDVTVDVHEVFSGSPGKTVRIAARGLGGSCDYGGYKAGEEMVIFGGIYDGLMHVSACSLTTLVSRAAAELAELRRMVKQGTATISGRVSVGMATSRDNIEVRVAGTTQVTRTDATGGYHFELPAGRYTVVPTSDPLLVPRNDRPVEAVAGACVHHEYPPSVAPDVKLGPGAVVGGIDLVVSPPLPTHTITAHVTLTGPGGPRGVEVVATERASGREYNRLLLRATSRSSLRQAGCCRSIATA